MTHLLVQYGLILLFVVVALESFGVPLPGETALVAGGVLAARGHLSIAAVIGVAATAAIVGDNIGYWVGRTGGRKLIERAPLAHRYADRVLPPAERFFERHGGKTVFIGRFVSILRFTAAWLAGISEMPWWRFFAWNAAGGIVWALGVGLLAFYGGKAAADAISHYGAYGAGAVVVAVVLGAVGLHVWRRRMVKS
ncbi:MAG TPA: DedA family protein [Gaiellaceae bacterium]|nr:DedA family protein [Gaiellaceae bacterium]